MQSTALKASLLAASCLLWSASASTGETGFLGQPSSTDREAAIHDHTTDKHNWPGLGGSWGGMREQLQDHGINIETVYTGELTSNFNPGLVNNKKETLYLDNLDITLTLDTGQAGLWDGGTLFIYGLGNSGRDPSADVIGDLQTVSNIEAPNTFLLYEAWFEQQFGELFSVLVGFHDLNSEFYVSEYSSLFLNSSPGIGAEISGNVPVSIFAKTGLAVRLHLHPTEHLYIQAAVYDGDPATRALKGSEGKMYIIESGITSDSGSYKLGYWQHTANITFNGHNYSSDYGYYGIIDQTLLTLGAGRSIGAFIRWGGVPGSRNEITSHTEFGLHMHGLIPARSEDDFGIAFIRANTHRGQESVYEFTYRAQLSSWLAVQPSLQVVRHPGSDPRNSTINVGLLRFEVAL